MSISAPVSYPVPGGTAYLSDQGKVAVDPGTGLQTFHYPAMGMYQHEWIPVAVDAMGTLQVSSGGGGITANVNLHDASGVGITSTMSGFKNGIDTNILNTVTVTGTISAAQSGPWTVTANQGTSPWVVSGTVTADAGSGTFQTNVTNSSIPVTQSGVWTTGRTWTLNNATDSVSVTPPTAATATVTPVSTTAGSSVPLLPTNSSRKGLILFNQSAGFSCYVAFGSASSPTSFTFQLVQGGSYHMDSTIYQGPISAYCGTGTILVTEM